MPLAIANTIRPDLALGGTIDGTATVRGPRAKPDITFSLQGKSIAAAALRQAGVNSLSVTAEGKTTAERLDLTATVSSPEGVRANVRGAAPGSPAVSLRSTPTSARSRLPSSTLPCRASGWPARSAVHNAAGCAACR